MDDLKIEIWRPKMNGHLGPVEVLMVRSEGGTYRVRPVGHPEWKIMMSEQVLNTYYEPTGDLVAVE